MDIYYPGEGLLDELLCFCVVQVHEEPVHEDHIQAIGLQLELSGIFVDEAGVFVVPVNFFVLDQEMLHEVAGNDFGCFGGQ